MTGVSTSIAGIRSRTGTERPSARPEFADAEPVEDYSPDRPDPSAPRRRREPALVAS